MNRINHLLIITVMGASLMLLVGLSPAPAQAAISDLTVTIRQNVNLREAPDAAATRITTLRRGTAFRIDGRTSSGQWVRGISERGVVGWIVNGPTGLPVSEIVGIRIVTPNTPFMLSPPEGSTPSPEGSSDTGESEADTANPSLVNTAPVRGFSYGGHIAGFDSNALGWMQRAGMTWIKKQWRYVDGQNPDVVSNWINTAHANGFRILIGVVGQNPNDVNNPGYFERYAGFVGGVAARGADAIEVWNEPNLAREWPAGQINPARYTELLRASYNAIKGANPDTLVISGAPAPTGAEAAFPGQVMNDNNFIAGMAAAGAASYMDCVGIHYNEGILPPTARSGDPRSAGGYYTRYLPAMIDVYYGAFGGSRPLCFTELGYLTPEGLGPLPPAFAWASDTSLAEQAAWLDGAVGYTARSGRVRLLIVWNVNYTNYGADPMAGYAMIRPGNTCPACEALAN